MRLPAYFFIFTTMAACSGENDGAARIAATRPDGSTKGGATPDSSGRGADARPRTDGDSGRFCEPLVAPPPDFFVKLQGTLDYEGSMTVEMVDAGAQALVGHGDGGKVQIEYGGDAPALPGGATLWASVAQNVFHANPFNSTVTSVATLRASEHGPVVAATLNTFVPTGSSQATFLGVQLTASLLCLRREITNIVTQESCITTDFYLITIHGDADVTLSPASEEHVTIGGVEYVVWLSDSSSETMDLTSQTPCVQDWAPRPGLSLAARAVRYADVLRNAPRDAGADSGR